MTIRNFTTEEGADLGAMVAKFCDDAEPEARLKVPHLQPRCQSCAFRAGKHLANQSPFTQMDAMKCVLEGVEFRCHQPDRAGEPCAGWSMMMLAKPDGAPFHDAPWEFSQGLDKDVPPHA